jgi:hypothetical protein
MKLVGFSVAMALAPIGTYFSSLRYFEGAAPFSASRYLLREPAADATADAHPCPQGTRRTPPSRPSSSQTSSSSATLLSPSARSRRTSASATARLASATGHGGTTLSFVQPIERSRVGLAAVPDVVDGLLGLGPALAVRVALDAEDGPAADARLQRRRSGARTAVISLGAPSVIRRLGADGPLVHSMCHSCRAGPPATRRSRPTGWRPGSARRMRARRREQGDFRETAAQAYLGAGVVPEVGPVDLELAVVVHVEQFMAERVL